MVAHKSKKPIKNDRLAPLFNERCSYNTMIEFITIRKLKGYTSCKIT